MLMSFVRTVRSRGRPEQGCQMVYFETKNSNLGDFEGLWSEESWYVFWYFVKF
jgi:hypothetical protein